MAELSVVKVNPATVAYYFLLNRTTMTVEAICVNCGGVVMQVEDYMSVARPVIVCAAHLCPLAGSEM